MSGHREAATAAPAREVLVARQPVLDAAMGVLGFELVSVGAGVLVDALSEVGLEPLTGGRPAWLRVPHETLLEVAALPMRSDRVVLQVRAGDGGDDELLVDALRPLARRGTSIALDGFAWRPGIEPLLDLASAVKLDLADHGLDGLAAQVEALAGRDLLLVATSVDRRADFEACRELGLHAFQGSFLAEPEIVPGRAVPTHRIEALGSVADLHSSVEFEELEAAIVRDLGMSHKLLRYANSALFFPSQRVGSVHEAMVILGARAVRRWATVLVLSGIRDQPHVLLLTALVRARMCELLCDDAGRRERAFTVGLFSVINRLLDMPMREALESLPLADEVVGALLRGEGPEGRTLRVVLAWELGDFDAAEAIGGAERVGRAYREAVAWADEATSAIR